MSNFESVKTIYGYEEFMNLMGVLVAEGKTSGPVQSESFIFYTKLNLQRLQRWGKTFSLEPENIQMLKNIRPQQWWIITEAWCGDGAQTMAVMYEIVKASEGKIAFKIVMRDDNPGLIDHYLTNGTRSIPKLVALDDKGNELFVWGPRPAPAQQMMLDWKADPKGKTYDDVEKDIHTWYAHDRGKTTEQELINLLKKY